MIVDIILIVCIIVLLLIILYKSKMYKNLLRDIAQDKIFITNYVWNKNIKNYVLAETKAKIGGRNDG